MIEEFNTLLEATREEIKRNPKAKELVISIPCVWYDDYNEMVNTYQEYMENLHWAVDKIILIHAFNRLKVYIHKTNSLDKD